MAKGLYVKKNNNKLLGLKRILKLLHPSLLFLRIRKLVTKSNT